MVCISFWCGIMQAINARRESFIVFSSPLPMPYEAIDDPNPRIAFAPQRIGRRENTDRLRALLEAIDETELQIKRDMDAILKYLQVLINRPVCKIRDTPVESRRQTHARTHKTLRGETRQRRTPDARAYASQKMHAHGRKYNGHR
jgi:hypothetical protein